MEMNRKANIMINFIFFILALGVIVAFISPIKTFVNIAQQSDNLNCRGYLHNGQNESQSSFAFNSTLNGGESGSTLGCVAIKLYLPYILLVVVIAGVAKLLYDQSTNFVTGEQSQTPY